ncbi:DEAD/DEAH box helicase family protein [Klebsiella pneumoniae]|nr:DEAD/DEAH box helicase family protein [Klebsiella pneumoniae]
MSACSEAALNTLCESCSHLFVDEAHHISASSWQTIRERFKDKRVVQFTATPLGMIRSPLVEKLSITTRWGSPTSWLFYKCKFAACRRVLL